MTSRHPHWVRRRPILAVVAVVSCAVAYWTGHALVAFPGADGPRVVRQYLVAAVPAFVAPFLLDRVPDVSATLVREPRERLLDQLAATAVCYATLLAGWLGGVGTNDALYEVLVTNILLTVILGGAARFGLGAVLVVSGLSAAWLLVGDSLAAALGFGRIDHQLETRGGEHAGRWVWLAVSMIAVGASFVLGLSRSWRSGRTA